MNGWHFLNVADRLRVSKYECDRRTSISRSYYAALNGVAARFASEGLPTDTTPRAHTYYYEALNATGDPDLEAIGTKLDQLKGARKRADYDMNEEAKWFTSKQAEMEWLRADTLRKQLAAVDSKRFHRALAQTPRVKSRLPPSSP